MTTSSEGTFGDQPTSKTDGSLVTDELEGALEGSEGLDWASMGLWADVAVRSDPERVRRTVSALTHALDTERATARRAKIDFRFRLIAAIVAIMAIIPVVILLSSHGGKETVLGSALAILVGLGSGLAAAAISAMYLARRARREREVIKKVLEYQRQRLTDKIPH